MLLIARGDHRSKSKHNIYYLPILHMLPDLHAGIQLDEAYPDHHINSLQPCFTDTPLNITLLGKVQVISKPFAGIHARNVQARGTICERRKVAEAPDGNTQNGQGCEPASDE